MCIRDRAATAEAPTEVAGISGITGAPTTSGRTPTLTAQIRSVRPPDVARQAISELGVLAREIAALPGEIEQSGLARMHKRAYLSIARLYQELAQEAWLAVAEERLEQTGAEPPYRQRAITIAREVTRLRRESQIAGGNREFPLPHRVPFLWRTRTRIIGQELRAWQGRIAIPPDPRRMGQGLLLLRGRLSLAYGSTFEVATLLLMIRLALTLTPMVSVAAALQLVSTLLLGDSLGAATWTAITLLSLLVWMLLLLLTARGRVSLGALLAASVFAPRRSPCNGVSGSWLIATLLRGWWVLLGALALLAIPVALGVSGLSIYALLTSGAMPLPPGSLAQAFAEVGTLVALIVGPLASAEVGAERVALQPRTGGESRLDAHRPPLCAGANAGDAGISRGRGAGDRLVRRHRLRAGSVHAGHTATDGWPGRDTHLASCATGADAGAALSHAGRATLSRRVVSLAACVAARAWRAQGQPGIACAAALRARPTHRRPGYQRRESARHAV